MWRAGAERGSRRGKQKIPCAFSPLNQFIAPGLSHQLCDEEVVFGISLALSPHLHSSNAPACFQSPQERNGFYLLEVP